MWTPVTISELHEVILIGERKLDIELFNFWHLIKIYPEKWQEKEHGTEGGGFWVVAILGKRIVWYNDIEEGFNISEYSNYGFIDEYASDDFEINHVVNQLFNLIKSKEDKAGVNTNL